MFSGDIGTAPLCSVVITEQHVDIQREQGLFTDGVETALR
jgi:hypothetical protein